MESPRRLTFAVTHPLTADRLLRGQLAFLQERGWEVSVVSSPGELLDRVREREDVATLPVPMEREIAPFADAVSLGRMRAALRRVGPDLVVAGTPKAGLLGTLAARSVGVPARAYHLRGLRFETTRGLKRRILRGTERLAAAAATVVLANSESLRKAFIESGLAPAGKIRVPGAGSAVGVDVEGLEAAAGSPEEQGALRERLGIAEDVPVVGFVGRFVRDKGVVELASAFRAIRTTFPGARLLMLGDFEPGDPVPEDVRRRLEEDPGIVLPGFVDAPARYLPLMDVLAFPSWREGMPNAPLEAAAFAVPTVGYRVTGTVDAVADGETGTLVTAGDSEALTLELLRYLEVPERRRRHGRAARERTVRLFSQQVVWEAWEAEFRRLVAGAGA